MTRPAFVWTLLFCIVLVNGLMAAPSVGHAQHHADHQGATHSTGICAWLCAAGVGIESSDIQLISELQFLERVGIPSFDIIFSAVPFSSFFRGPPSLA